MYVWRTNGNARQLYITRQRPKPIAVAFVVVAVTVTGHLRTQPRKVAHTTKYSCTHDVSPRILQHKADITSSIAYSRQRLGW